MSTPETNPDDDSYPSAWRPSYIRERDEKRAEFETFVAGLSDAEIARIRKDQS